MLVKGIFTNISGSTGGITGSRNKGGQYLRARVNPVNPNSTAQQTARSRFTDANDSWSSLTEAQRTAWNDWAQLQVWKNRLGDTIQLSGQQGYIGAYSASESALLVPAVAPPAPNTRPAQLIIPSMIPSLANNNVGGFTAAVLTANDAYTIAVSGPLPPGVTSYKGPYRQTNIVGGTEIASDFSDQMYNALQTRTVGIAVGMRFAVRIRAITLLGNYSEFAERITEPTVA